MPCEKEEDEVKALLGIAQLCLKRGLSAIIPIDKNAEKWAYVLQADLYNKLSQSKVIQEAIALMTLVDVALMYQKERAHNDTSPYDNVLARLTAEMEEILGDGKAKK